MKLWREMLSLFVDDGSLAVGVLALIAAAAFALPPLGLSPALNALAFYGGCLALLVENVMRRARR